MSVVDLAPLPWELIAAPLTSAGDTAPTPAAHAAPPAEEARTTAGTALRPRWAPSDWHIADAALASRHAHAVAMQAARDAERRARALAHGAVACVCCDRLLWPADGMASPAGAPLCVPCAATQTEPAAPSAPEAPATPAARPVAAERSPVPAAALPAGVELRRLAAAALLTCTPLGVGRYTVRGGAEPHTVDLTADGAALPRCTCGDAHWRPQYVCKHQLAARAAAGQVPIAAAVAVLRALVERRALRLPGARHDAGSRAPARRLTSHARAAAPTPWSRASPLCR